MPTQEDDTPYGLLVTSDAKGNILLTQQEQYICHHNHNGTDHVSRYIVNLQPKVFLIPSISEEMGPVSGYTLVRSPAKYILSTSSHLLVTLHAEDNRIRLWNTNDGRCIMASPPQLLHAPCDRIFRVRNHPGHVYLVGR